MGSRPFTAFDPQLTRPCSSKAPRTSSRSQCKLSTWPASLDRHRFPVLSAKFRGVSSLSGHTRTRSTHCIGAAGLPWSRACTWLPQLWEAFQIAAVNCSAPSQYFNGEVPRGSITHVTPLSAMSLPESLLRSDMVVCGMILREGPCFGQPSQFGIPRAQRIGT